MENYNWFYFKRLTEEQKEKYADKARLWKAKKSEEGAKAVSDPICLDLGVGILNIGPCFNSSNLEGPKIEDPCINEPAKQKEKHFLNVNAFGRMVSGGFHTGIGLCGFPVEHWTQMIFSCEYIIDPRNHLLWSNCKSSGFHRYLLLAT